MKDLYGNVIQKGCHVRLTCGDKIMVVDSYGHEKTSLDELVFCEWEEDGELFDGTFKPYMLEVTASVEDLQEAYLE